MFRTISIALLLLTVAVGCSAQSPSKDTAHQTEHARAADGNDAAAAAFSANRPCDIDRSKVIQYQRYEDVRTGRWAILIVPPKTVPTCLIALAGKLRQEEPDVQFEFFDATGPELQQYYDWATNGMKSTDPYPEKWTRKHNTAILQPMSDGVPCALWQLFDGEYKSLASFDRVKCDVPATRPRMVSVARTPRGTTAPAVKAIQPGPSGATARCADGTYSYSASRRGACSRHGGVAQWL